jgi:hypothetical protein
MELTSRSPVGDTAGSITIDDGRFGQLAYHVRWSAALAASGQTSSAAQHALLATALLDVIGGAELREASSALDLPDVVMPATTESTAQRSATVELGYQFVSHFTSDGRYDLADLYLEATRRIAGDI